MELTIFAKKRNTPDGKKFYTYLSTLKKKDGTEQTVSVKFRDECGSPKPENCPCNIEVKRENINLTNKEFVREDTGETATSYTLWVSAWTDGSPFVDHSLDDYDI